jgi:uncharacterized membrane protein
MRKTMLIIFLLMLLAGMPTSARAAPDQSEEAIVRSILFWSNGCPRCTQTITGTLPPLQDRYKEKLSIMLVEMVSVKDIETLYALGSELGFPKEQVGVPFLLVNHTALIGADDIRDQFSGLIDRYIAVGGADYPDLPQVNELLSKGVAFASFKLETQSVPQAATDTQGIDMALAWGTMTLMGAALIFSIAMIIRAFNGVPLGKASRGLELAIPILSIAGLGASIYLSYVEVTQSNAICGPVGDCNAVQNSPYAKLFGVVPIGVVGMVGYSAILFAWLWQRYRTDSLSRVAGPVMFGMALFGTLFSVYLTYLEIYIIHAVCIWCLSSAVIMAVLMVLSLPPITQWLAISDEEEQVIE